MNPVYNQKPAEDQREEWIDPEMEVISVVDNTLTTNNNYSATDGGNNYS